MTTDRLEDELRELVEDRKHGEEALADYNTGIAWAIARLARGWLIERARTKRLRKQLEKANERFETHSDHDESCPRGSKCTCGYLQAWTDYCAES